MRRVVFNADDLGLSPGVDRGIAEAARGRVVREASLLVTGPTAESGLALLRAAAPDAGVGLHFSLTLGRALTGRLHGLTDAAGELLPLPRVLAACLARAVDRAEVEAELRAQLARARSLGVEPSHLNGHHHVHVFPVVRDAVLAVAAEARVGHVRVPSEGLATSRSLTLRRALLAALSLDFRRRLAARGLPSLPLVGLELASAPDHAAASARLLRRLPAPAVEWIVHPHERDAELVRVDRDARWGRPGAPDEIATLTGPWLRTLLDEQAVASCRYADLGGVQP